jgi:23S rRNA (cytidine1920-2'-O)/16S rRNA (cytidine1409-2'-O)-methyltransferase
MRKRLDEIMVERGLVATRARARGLIMRGHVRVNGAPAEKAGLMVAEAAAIEIAEAGDRYLSFGADKLALALDTFGGPFDPAGCIALDIGASTGGFTDVLLKRGARRVYAVDVGHDQLHMSLRADPRVIPLEGTDARTLTSGLIPDPLDAIVADVSFVSLTKILAPALTLTGPGAWLIALVKPQFEAGPEAVGKGGIVRDQADRVRAIEIVRTWLGQQPGWHPSQVVTWPGIPGRTNEEYLIGALRDA